MCNVFSFLISFVCGCGRLMCYLLRVCVGLLFSSRMCLESSRVLLILWVIRIMVVLCLWIVCSSSCCMLVWVILFSVLKGLLSSSIFGCCVR